MSDAKPEKPPGDWEQRRLAIEDTKLSFVVEASAGTGKTSALLGRILHLVLDSGPDGPPLPLAKICAITFTEKAAGEMKVRLRQELEKKLADAETPADRRKLVEDALGDLETASISTFHSFAVSLLKERPIEAELDPRFTALDDIRSELFFREVWEPWINQALTERHPVLERALKNGFRLQTLVGLAKVLRRNWLHVRALACDPPPSEERCREEIEICLKRGAEFQRDLIHPEDLLAVRLQEAMDWLEHPSEEGGELSGPGSAGAGKNWAGGKEMVREVKDFLKGVVGFQARCKQFPKQRLLHEVICWIKDDFMTGEWEKRKRERGLLDFDDQLRLARDLLLHNKAVRRDFQQQYRTLLVDEFQDTDPIQWDMVLLLTSADLDETDSARLKPEPGRLFLVGDPKQSIYRFRNADIETYLDIVGPQRLETLGLKRLELTTNFRSVPSILRFVDAAFENAMEACSYQSRYQPFGGEGHRHAEAGEPHVYLLGDANGEDDGPRNALEVVDIEAQRIAGLILEMNGSEEWKVRDPDKAGKDSGRAARFGDIAILVPAYTHANVLEEKLRDLGIPYVLEGGKFYYQRSEVSSAVVVLRAVANPNDRVALYGALRSIFFGLSDEDLLRAHIDDLPPDYRKEVPTTSPLHRPFEILRDLHRQRHNRRAGETFEVLLQRSGVREVLAARGFQSLANLNKLGRTLRAFQDDATFSRVIDLLDTIDEEELAESESRLMEDRSNAVRIMSIHRAKGLDFPIVIAAFLGLGTNSKSKEVLVDRGGKKVFAIKAGSKESGLMTPQWEQFADEEKNREEAELVRLLYVAMTRAKDRLVLGTHTKDRRKPDGTERYVPSLDKTRLKPLDSFLADCHSGKNDWARLIDGTRLDAKTGAAPKTPQRSDMLWESIAEREYAELRSLLENTPASANLKAAGRDPDAPAAEQRYTEDRALEAAAARGVRLGVAFHEAMERVDLFASDGSEALVREVATRHRLDPKSAGLLHAMVKNTLSSKLLDHARASALSGRRVLRELPFIRPQDSQTIEEGKMDLLFEAEDGWILVDYKTDRIPEEAEDVKTVFTRKYAVQMREYVEALRDRSIRIKAACLLLARTGDTVQME